MAAVNLSVNQAKLLKRHSYILKKLSKTNDKNRKKILMNAPTALFKALALIFKLLDGSGLTLTRNQKGKLKKHASLIRSAHALKSSGAIKTQLVQKGCALGAILATILPVLGGLIKSIF